MCLALAAYVAMTDGEMSKEAKNKEIDDLLASSEEEEEEQADAGAQPGCVTRPSPLG